ncbi:MAG: hypothetical protein E7E83_04140 [Enterobacter ludwigii]|nr:hypothetical protein [Enterobacter ludwigii]
MSGVLLFTPGRNRLTDGGAAAGVSPGATLARDVFKDSKKNTEIITLRKTEN